MLSDQELSLLCDRLALTESARLTLARIRAAPPTRRVRSASGNVSVRYPSRKMGMVIQAESHRVELAGVYEMEYDSAVLEYYDQPPSIKLVYPAANGRRTGVIHTPDFFVVRQTELGWEEWKALEALPALAEKMPHRYVLDSDGTWRCPPGEEYATPLGFYYRVCTPAKIDWILQRNLVFLADYLREEQLVVADQAQAAIFAALETAPGVTLETLLREAEGFTADDVYQLVVTGVIFIDLRATPLAEPARVQVFRDESTAKAWAALHQPRREMGLAAVRTLSLQLGTPLVWDGRPWTLGNAGETTLTLLSPEGQLVELPLAQFETLATQGKIVGLALDPQPSTPNALAMELWMQASAADLCEANRRLELIKPVLLGQAQVSALGSDATTERTLYRWVQRYRAAEQVFGQGYVGLLQMIHRRGNRTPRLPEAMVTLMEEFVASRYETLKQRHKLSVYGELVRACQAKGLEPPCYKTFSRVVAQRPQYEQRKKRAGGRAAYPQEPLYWELSLTTPRHGDRPFEVVHIDHTPLDLELVDSTTGHPLGRPWATFLMDAYTRRLLALWLSFDPPSYRACLMVLRECVRRCHRLPETVVVDGGREFESVWFESFLARYECTKKTRPGAKPRYGGVLERLFGTAHTEFVHNLVGNTQLTKNVRQLTKAVDPKRQAAWTLPAFHARLCEWGYEVYETCEHPALGQSPREAFAAGLALGGRRTVRWLAYDADFILSTLPSHAKGELKVQPNLGVKIHYIYYWSEAFRHPEVEQCRVPVRYDPYDIGTAYAFVQHRWVRCISEYYARFKDHSEREILLAAAELRRRHQNHTRRFTITAVRLAEFLESTTVEEQLLIQRRQDLETRALVEPLARANNSNPGGPAAVAPTETSTSQPAGVTQGVAQAESGYANADSHSSATAAAPTSMPMLPDNSIYGDF